jgi:hypothetical protein
MANPPGLDAWLKYADQNARTPEEREKMRADIYARFGVEPPKKKRGGLAGLYDRNKGLIQAAIPTLAGMLIPGVNAMVAGGLAGGLARGLDRPGKGGVGLDLGQAAQGALTGAALGQAGRYLGGKMGVGPGAVPKAATGATGGYSPEFTSAGRSANDVAAMQQLGAGSTTASVGSTSVPSSMAGASKLSALLKPEAIGGITAGAGQALGGYMEREAAGERLDFEREQRELEQQRANRLAQLLAPMAGAQAGLVGSQYGGYGRMG